MSFATKKLFFQPKTIMAKISYELSTKINKNGESEILLNIQPERGVHYRMKSGVFVSPENYGRLMKAGRITSVDYLMELEDKLLDAFPCDKTKALHILDMVKNSDNLLAIYDNFVRNRMIEKQLTFGTQQIYNCVRVILNEMIGGKCVSVKCIDTDFLNDFIKKMIDKGLTNVTQTNYFRVLKVFLGHLEKQGMIDHKVMLYKPHFKVGNNDVVFLTHNELYRLVGLELKGTESTVRDLFCIQCFTGLRYSDLINIRKENIREDANGKYISLLTKKTTQRLQIYFNSTACEILERYNWTLPHFNGKRMNSRLPEIARKAGIDGDVEIVSFVGGERKVEHKRKWECIKTHCGRRTFICLCIENGVPTTVIRAITGHKQLSSFERYVGVGSKTKSDVVAKLEI